MTDSDLGQKRNGIDSFALCQCTAHSKGDGDGEVVRACTLRIIRVLNAARAERLFGSEVSRGREIGNIVTSSAPPNAKQSEEKSLHARINVFVMMTGALVDLTGLEAEDRRIKCRRSI